MISFSRHKTEYREGEQYVKQHSFGIILLGTMELNDGKKKMLLQKDELYLIHKKHLLKFAKLPTENGEIQALSIFFDDELLREFSLEYGYKSEHNKKTEAYVKLKKNKELVAYLQSLLSYEDLLNNNSQTKLSLLKQKEALLLLLQYDQSLKNGLFDFSDPYKIDLEIFMNENFQFNVNLDRFAYLTGRSLATFKRDFQNTFNASPRSWLQQKRLEEAHSLLTQKKQSISDIYLDLGFENLSHFSFAFKKKFGYAPTELTKTE